MEITHSKGTLYPALQLASFRVRKMVLFVTKGCRCDLGRPSSDGRVLLP